MGKKIGRSGTLLPTTKQITLGITNMIYVMKNSSSVHIGQLLNNCEI